MKQGHFAAFFLILYLGCSITLYINQKRYDEVLEEKERVEEGLKKAIEYTADQLLVVMNEPVENRLLVFQSAFFEAFYIYMGALEDTELQELLGMHLPMLVYVQEDGAFFYYAEEIQKNGVIELVYQWSALQKFDFPEHCTDEEKKGVMAKCLEERSSEIISVHNYIAAQYGLEYTFYVPDFLQDTSSELELPMLFAVFQGWPLTAAGDIVYENCMDASVYIQEVKNYVVELPGDISDTYCYYHEAFCEKLEEKDRSFLKEVMTKEQAIYQYGAVPCGVCIEEKGG